MRRLQTLPFREVAASGRLDSLSQSDRSAREGFADAMPFRVNSYVLDELIDWSAVPVDPFFKVYFGSTDYFTTAQRALLECAKSPTGDGDRTTRWGAFFDSLAPHPAEQQRNVPRSDRDGPLQGVQHKYADTVLYFPHEGQTCHAYCSFCFRWAQFIGDSNLRFEASGPEPLVAYLREHPNVSDVIVTGGDPLVMKATVLGRHLRALAQADGTGIRTLRIGTRAVGHWPSRFVDAPDADELLALLAELGHMKRVVLMLHTLHPRELETTLAQAAIARLLAAGVELRMQGPLLRGVNDDPATLARLWTRGQQMGLVPYYLFVERVTGPHAGFAIPIVEALRIFEEAHARVPGLAKTVRGPVLSTTAGKVHVVGSLRREGVDGDLLALRFLRARDPSLEGPLFLAEARAGATWFDDLVPVDEASRGIFRRAAEVPA